MRIILLLGLVLALSGCDEETMQKLNEAIGASTVEVAEPAEIERVKYSLKSVQIPNDKIKQINISKGARSKQGGGPEIPGGTATITIEGVPGAEYDKFKIDSMAAKTLDERSLDTDAVAIIYQNGIELNNRYVGSPNANILFLSLYPEQVDELIKIMEQWYVDTDDFERKVIGPYNLRKFERTDYIYKR